MWRVRPIKGQPAQFHGETQPSTTKTDPYFREARKMHFKPYLQVLRLVLMQVPARWVRRLAQSGPRLSVSQFFFTGTTAPPLPPSALHPPPTPPAFPGCPTAGGGFSTFPTSGSLKTPEVEREGAGRHCGPAMTPGELLPPPHTWSGAEAQREASREGWGWHGERGVRRRAGGRGWGRGGEGETRRRRGSEESWGSCLRFPRR